MKYFYSRRFSSYVNRIYISCESLESHRSPKCEYECEECFHGKAEAKARTTLKGWVWNRKQSICPKCVEFQTQCGFKNGDFKMK